jgi:hypothetical protein
LSDGDVLVFEYVARRRTKAWSAMKIVDEDKKFDPLFSSPIPPFARAGYVWICVDVCGCVWMCVDVCGCVWMCVHMQRDCRVLTWYNGYDSKSSTCSYAKAKAWLQNSYPDIGWTLSKQHFPLAHAKRESGPYVCLFLRAQTPGKYFLEIQHQARATHYIQLRD